MVPAHGQEPQPAHPSEQEMLGSAFRGRCWGPALTKTWPGCDDNDRDNLRDKPTAGSPQPHTWKDRWEQWEAGTRHSKEGTWSAVFCSSQCSSFWQAGACSPFLKTQRSCWLHPAPQPSPTIPRTPLGSCCGMLLGAAQGPGSH